MKKSKNELMKKTIEVSYILLVTAICSTITSFVLCQLWGWLLVPIFDIGRITISEAFGLIVVLSYLKNRNDKIKKGKELKWINEAFSRVINRGLFFLVVGLDC